MQFNKDNIKGLAIKQPYADLVVHHGKVETRTWDTQYRGYVLFTASTQPYTWKTVEMISSSQIISIVSKVNYLSGFRTGVAIGIGKLVSTRLMTKEDEKIALVDFQQGLFLHFYEDVTPIHPFKIKGKLGLFTLEESDIEKIQIIHS